jgi:hypothetical protein
MTISEIKAAVENLPRQPSGKKSIPISLRQEITKQYQARQTSAPDFAKAIGLSTSTIHYYRHATPSVAKRPPAKMQGFKQVRVREDGGASWVVRGPNGLCVECETLEKVSQLWRSLC